MHVLDRRQFCLTIAAAGSFAAKAGVAADQPLAAQKPASKAPVVAPQPEGHNSKTPYYLQAYESLYASDPRAAALRWFTDAKYGLFIHYALASLMPGGKAEFLKLDKADQQKLQQRFTAEKFSSDAIAGMAVAAGMRYVTFTTRHLGNLAMFRTATTDFTSLRSPAKRDLVADLAESCRRRGLGLFLYCPPDIARTTADVVDRNRVALRELLTQYGPIAGIWLDGIAYYYKEPKAYSGLAETFALVRALQPQCLISFKTGAIGDEDFLAPEHNYRPQRGRLSEEAWQKLKNKPVEVCTTLQLGKAGWINNEQFPHMSAEQVLKTRDDTRRQGFNLLLNSGLRGDGSIHPADLKALTESGKSV